MPVTNPTPEAEAVARLNEWCSHLDLSQGYAARFGTPRSPDRMHDGSVYWNDHLARDIRLLLSTLPQAGLQIAALRSAPAQPDAGEGLTPADAKWLATFLQGQKEEGHCGEGTFERRERAAWNSRLDRISAALMSETEG